MGSRRENSLGFGTSIGEYASMVSIELSSELLGIHMLMSHIYMIIV